MKKLLTTTMACCLLVPLTSAWAGAEEKKPCKENAATCAQMMKAHFAERGWVGINMDYDKERGVVAITNVVANSPASRAGFRVGDVLRGLNNVDYTEENEKALEEEYASFKPGNKVTFRVERDGKPVAIQVQLEQIPDAILAQWIGQHILEAHQAEVAATAADEPGESP